MVKHFPFSRSAAVLSAVSIGVFAGDSLARKDFGSMEMYTQTLVIKTADGQSKVVAPTLAPVYDAHHWGLSTRWDDSNPNSLNVRKKMLENGVRGTFYLNSRRPEKQEGSLAYRLTGKGECSVGGHSVTHPKLPELPANESFWQLMANRVTLECLTDRPVNSLAFPYGQYQAKDRPEVIKGVSEAFLRTGYHHCVYSSFVTRNTHLPENVVSTGLQVVPGDRQVNETEFWQHLDKIRKHEADYRRTSDCIFLGVHPWQQGEELEKLGKLMGELVKWDDFWHCTQTEYAAFTRQRRMTTIAPEAGGTFKLSRPCAFDLGNDVPLTLVFNGVVASATVDGAACDVRTEGDRSIVNVPHSAGKGVPVRIDAAEGGKSSKFPGLTTSLRYDKNTAKVAYSLSVAEGSSVTDAIVTLSVPPSLQPGVLRSQHDGQLTAGNWNLNETLFPTEGDAYWQDGKLYFVAQLDFVLNGERGRLFTTYTILAAQ